MVRPEWHRLMGGQACVLYGAAQFSKDIDFLILASDVNFAGLHAALAELEAVRIAVSRFDPEQLARGHAMHYRCRAADVAGLRIDLMTCLREVTLKRLHKTADVRFAAAAYGMLVNGKQ